MIAELNKFESVIHKLNGLQITNLQNENECEDYFGFNFQIGIQNFKFRKSKITPKKAGQFVTLWKRNDKEQTEPFNENDIFNFYVIATEQDEKFGFFVFPKKILVEKQILTTHQKEGKRGFRLYPTWTKTESKQAEKTQKWQTKYFIDLKDNKTKNTRILNSILKH